jgi:hypothetical protein
MGSCVENQPKTEKAPHEAGPSLLGTDQTGTSDESPIQGARVTFPAHVFEMCFMFRGRNPRQTTPLCRTRTAKVQPLRTGSILMRGGETHVREAPPPSPWGRGLPIFAKKKPRTRRGS